MRKEKIVLGTVGVLTGAFALGYGLFKNSRRKIPIDVRKDLIESDFNLPRGSLREILKDKRCTKKLYKSVDSINDVLDKVYESYGLDFDDVTIIEKETGVTLRHFVQILFNNGVTRAKFINMSTDELISTYRYFISNDEDTKDSPVEDYDCDEPRDIKSVNTDFSEYMNKPELDLTDLENYINSKLYVCDIDAFLGSIENMDKSVFSLIEAIRNRGAEDGDLELLESKYSKDTFKVLFELLIGMPKEIWDKFVAYYEECKIK